MTADVQTTSPRMPDVRSVSAKDIMDSVKLALGDMAASPGKSMAFGLFAAFFGIAIVASIAWLGIPWMIYPFMIGFPLAGPFIAVGLYEISRRRERGEPVPLSGIFKVMWAQRGREVSWMAFVMLFVFWVWVYQIRLLMALFLGMKSFSTLGGFMKVVLGSTEGWAFLIIGHAAGAVLSLVMFSLTVVAIPLLLDRELDVVTAMITSVKAVFASPVVMLGWGLIVTVAVIAASLPMFLGIIIVLPLLGHTTWHIYRRAVVPLEG